MAPAFQQTLSQSVPLSGTGIHTGRTIAVSVFPAPIHFGIQFRRVDLADRPQLAVGLEAAIDSSFATTLGNAAMAVATVEHLLAALAGLGIDNALVELDGPEVPVFDGSSRRWVQAFREAGIRALPAPRLQRRLLKNVRVECQDKWAEARPASSGLTVDCAIDFSHPAIGRQSIRFEAAPHTFEYEIAAARTFGFLHEISAMRERGLAMGGSTENAIVLGNHGVLNADGLRWPDEFVRHKALDLLGDLALLGHPLAAHVVTHKSGHALNLRLARAILADPTAWRIEPQPAPLAEVRPLRRPAAAALWAS